MKPDQLNSIVIPPEPGPIGTKRRMIRLLIAVVIIVIGALGAAYLKNSAPKAKKRPPQKQIPTVRVATLTPDRHGVVVQALGTVIPARQVVLKSRVAGQVLSLHPEFTEGGLLKKGDPLIQLEDTDYRLLLSQKKSNLVNTEYELKLEMGRQEVAQREWHLLRGNASNQKVDSELALRKPHLEKARADLAAAQAELERAELDLERTRIRSPFNAIVNAKFVDVGSQVSPQDPLAELVGTDVYWIQASIPVDRLDWIRVPYRSGEDGSPAIVYYAGGHIINGKVIRLMSSLAGEGLMARILIEVPHPYQNFGNRKNGPPLLVGESVRVDIEGRQLENVYTIPRTALRDGDKIWLLGSDGTLLIKTVTPVWRDRSTVVIQDSLKAGDQLIVSDLPAPIAGMKLQGMSEARPSAQREETPESERTGKDHHG